jgi:prepilin-type N-terminal cleavage/methylation domain-containing protein
MRLMRPCNLQRGFTMVELIMVLVIVGVLGSYAIVRAETGYYTLTSQASTLARDVRHAQALSHTWGRSLRVSISSGANGTYSVSCVTSSSTYPCNSSPVIDPATGLAFSGALQQNAVLGGTSTLDFDSAGKPSGAAAYTVTYGSATKTVSVLAVTGNVSISP